MACCPIETRAVAAVLALSMALVAPVRAAPPPQGPASVAATLLPPTPAAVKEARELAKVARKLYDNKHFAAAAELYRKAHRLDYAKPDYLYGVGRCEQRAGNFAAAVVAFEQLLVLLPPTDGLVPKAQAALDEARAAREADLALPGGAVPERTDPPNAKEGVAPAAEPTPAAAPEPVTAVAAPPAASATPSDGGRLAWVEPPRPPRGSRTPALVLLTVAAAATVTGVVAGVAAVAANADANAFRVPDSGAFDPMRIDKAQARARVADINLKTKVAGIAGATAALVGAIGAWLWPRGKGPVVGTDGESVLLGGRF